MINWQFSRKSYKMKLINTIQNQLKLTKLLNYQNIVITQPIEYMPRDRRSVPVFEAYDENDLPEQFEENQEVIFVPEEALIEAAAEEQDEIELRQRIAEIATILNERATRRLRFF
nr:hypothetical protein E02D9.2 - Caenorhabditis elegans [Caenorhabditis elegans]